MVPVYQTNNVVHLALAESLLTAYEIPYFVHNRHFSSLYPGVQIGLLNAQTIMVADEYENETKEILAELLAEAVEEKSSEKSDEKGE